MTAVFESRFDKILGNGRCIEILHAGHSTGKDEHIYVGKRNVTCEKVCRDLNAVSARYEPVARNTYRSYVYVVSSEYVNGSDSLELLEAVCE